MKYLAVLGRLPKLSLAELEAQFGENVRQISPVLAVFDAEKRPEINRFGGVMKFGELITLKTNLVDFLQEAFPEGKIVLGISEYGRNANGKKSQHEAMKIKKILSRAGRSVRVLEADKNGVVSTVTAHHNQLGEKNGHVELIKVGDEWYMGCGVQNITAYAKRDQARPARDAKVGMLPPKLAQILINLCGPLKEGSILLDPFCGTGVVLQEALLMGYSPVGSDANERMVEYTTRNLKWLLDGEYSLMYPAVNVRAQKLREKQNIEKQVFAGDATETKWPKIDAVACETYLGSPMSQPPAEIKLKTEKQECSRIILGFLKNLAAQAKAGTPIALAVPAWKRPNGSYERLNILDEIAGLGYNVVKFRSLEQNDLLYYREGQIVAREIIILRK